MAYQIKKEYDLYNKYDVKYDWYRRGDELAKDLERIARLCEKTLTGEEAIAVSWRLMDFVRDIGKYCDSSVSFGMTTDIRGNAIPWNAVDFFTDYWFTELYIICSNAVEKWCNEDLEEDCMDYFFNNECEGRCKNCWINRLFQDLEYEEIVYS